MIVQATVAKHPNGDWEGLYIDGRLVSQGHTVSADDMGIALQRHGSIIFQSRELKLNEDDDLPFMLPTT